MRILVCGSRTFSDRTSINTVLDGLRPDGPYPLQLTIIEGGARGADEYAKDWAVAHDVEHMQFPADWKTHSRKAGHIRNQQMLDEGKPELVIAFVNKPLERSVGTYSMVRLARQARVPVWVVEVQPPLPSRPRQRGLFDS
jgi:hypothetical protein